MFGPHTLVVLITVSAWFCIPSAVKAAPAAHAQDRILVLPKSRSDEPQTLAALRQTKRHDVLRSFPSLHGLQVLKLNPGESPLDVVAQYKASGTVEFAEPDYVRTLNATPNDPRFLNGQSWGLHNTGQNGGTEDADIDAPEGWDVITGAPGIIVAILDTGIRSTHEDLSGNIWSVSPGGAHGWNTINDSANTEDDEGHGTIVAGAIGAAGNNAKGMAGVAWQVRLMAAKCFDDKRQGNDSDIIEAIEFCRSNRAHIVNASFGSYAYSQSLSNAIRNARDEGMIFVCSAGNEGRDIDSAPYYPACYDLDNIISVGASTRFDTVSSASNIGRKNIDVFAPGDQMYSSFFAGNASYLGPFSGTSFAAPLVAGTLALVKERFPGETPAQSISRVLQGADTIHALADKGAQGRRLNLKGAVSAPIRLTIVAGRAEQAPYMTITANPQYQLIAIETSPDLRKWFLATTLTNTPSGTITVPFSTSQEQVFFRAVSQ